MAIVHIRRNADGVIRQHIDEYWDGSDYMWADGNYSCDCNRYLFFMRAAGEDEGDLMDARCGDDAYSVQITDEAGKVLYEDDSWAPQSPAAGQASLTRHQELQKQPRDDDG